MFLSHISNKLFHAGAFDASHGAVNGVKSLAQQALEAGATKKELMKPLLDTGKLACLLIQLPPGMKFMKDRVETFLKILPSDIRFALEYRNKTWLTDEAHELLSDYNVAVVVVDEPLLPPEVRVNFR